MLTVEEIIEETRALSEEERATLVDAVLQTLYQTTPEHEQKWLAIARERIGQIERGEVQLVDGREVFERLLNRYSG